MQEINLLQTKIQDRNMVWEKRNRLITTIFVVFLILELAASGVFFMLTRSKQGNIGRIEGESRDIQTRINNNQADLSKATSFQAQLKNLRVLVDNHIYWSVFFEELSKFTYTKAQYLNIQAETGGKIHMEGIAPSYTDLGKLMMGLNNSSKFTNIKLLSVQPSSLESAGYLFTMDLTASSELFKK